MPKIKKPKLTNRKDGRAVVHWKGKMHVMGKSGAKKLKLPTTVSVSKSPKIRWLSLFCPKLPI